MVTKASPSFAASSPTAQPPQRPVPAQSGPPVLGTSPPGPWGAVPAGHTLTALSCLPALVLPPEDPSLHLPQGFPGPRWVLMLTAAPFLSACPGLGTGQKA